MKIISEAACQSWLLNTLGKSRDQIANAFQHSSSFALPVDAGKKTVLARTIAAYAVTHAPGLFWLTGWSIFPSCENPALFDGYRASLGESRSIYDAPGHIFDGDDLSRVECLLGLSLYFFWDALLVAADGQVAMMISHDEFVDVLAKTETELAAVTRQLDKLGLRANG